MTNEPPEGMKKYKINGMTMILTEGLTKHALKYIRESHHKHVSDNAIRAQETSYRWWKTGEKVPHSQSLNR